MFIYYESVLLNSYIRNSEKDQCLEFKKAKGPDLLPSLLSLGYELQACINSFICALL